MKKVLILAYDFPPYVSVGGLRPYSWYKYFHEFGVYPIVVTRQWGNEYGNYLDYIAPSESSDTVIEESEFGTIIRTPYKPNLANRIMLKYGDSKFSFIRKAITAYYEFAQFLFFVGTKSGLYFGAKKYLKENKVDCIIATGSPHILFKYASKLSKKHKTPWIADYRDPWSQSQSRNKNGKLKRWNMFFEKRYLKNASSIAVASMFVQHKIAVLLPEKDYVTILNGYDPIAAKKAMKVKPDADKMKIAFIGTIYLWHPIESVLSAFSELLDKNAEFNFQIDFFGINNQKRIQETINNKYLNLIDKVVYNTKMPNQILLPIIAKSHLMLLFNDYSLIGTKIYDYLAVKRNILLCYTEEKASSLIKLPYSNDGIESINNHVQQDLIQATNSGVAIKNKDELIIKLNEYYLEFSKTKNIECNSTNIEYYSREYQTGVLSGIIEKYINEKAD